MGLSLEEAFDRAWLRLVEFNPMPATIGRICPHPCETDCTRSDKDGAVSINAMERFLGDWAVERNLQFPAPVEPGREESIGVIGSGPAGLSFAYQMARRGYPVTLYDRQPSPGGMLRYGIPSYRLPIDTLEKEIQRIVGKLQESGVDQELQQWVMEEMQRPIDLDGLVREIPNQQVAAQVYAASLFAIEVDTQGEQRYLADFAARTGLNQRVTQELHRAVGVMA